jgi:xanthine dehydrogenase YagT iron-sulfur-binding subunit
MRIGMSVNGSAQDHDVEPRTLLVQYLREACALTGTKIGCDTSSCGACTVLVDGESVKSCTMLAAQADGASITTIEGLANGDTLHPLQAAFVQHDGFQCGYCTSGQICSAAGMLAESRAGMPSYVTDDLTQAHPELSEVEIRERMSGNICRCAAYPNIVAAIKQAAETPA